MNDGKNLSLHLLEDRKWKYCSASLEAQWKQEPLTERWLGLPIELIDPTIYQRPAHQPFAKIAPEDELLFPISLAKVGTGIVKSKTTTMVALPHLAMIKKISLDQSAAATAAAEEEGKSSSESSDKKALLGDSREDQIKAIDQTFIDARDPHPQHPTRKHLKAVKVLEILPDDAIDALYTWIEFDSNPLDGITKENISLSLAPIPSGSSSSPLENAITKAPLGDVRSMETTVSSSSTLIRQFEGDNYTLYVRNDGAALDDGEQLFDSKRDYVRIPNAAVKEEQNYFFIESDDKIYYSKYHQRLRLSKRARKNNNVDPLDAKRIAKIIITETEERGEEAEGGEGGEENVEANDNANAMETEENEVVEESIDD